MRGSASWALGALLVGLVTVGRAPERTWADNQIGINRITQVQPGMTMLQVLQTLGPPSDIVGHSFYYRDQGKIIFASKGDPLDQTKVEKVEPSLVQNPVP
jgi:hypothetical protein